MTKIETKDQYDRAVQRVEELLPLITDKTPLDDPNSIELELLSNLVAEYSTLSKILCKCKQDSVVSSFLYLDSVFKNEYKLIHN